MTSAIEVFIAAIGYRKLATYVCLLIGYEVSLNRRYIFVGIDDIIFMVDGKQRQNMMENAPGLKLSDAIGFPSSEIKLWNTGTSIAPFDRSFYVSLGLSVGGIRDFADGSDNNGKPKPWSNSDPRAMISFWNNRKEWQKTWNNNSAFVVKSIKITAV